jgi:hypothetical protein
MPGKMAGSDPRAGVRVTRGAGSSQPLASVLQEDRETRTLMPVWDSSGESRLKRDTLVRGWTGWISSQCFDVGRSWSLSL